MGEKDPVSVEIVDLLIFSASSIPALTWSFSVSSGVSSMFTWMFHRFVSLRVAYNMIMLYYI